MMSHSQCHKNLLILVVSAVVALIFLTFDDGQSQILAESDGTQSGIVGPAGSFSAKRLAYPVPQEALKAYLEHQDQSSIATLLRKSHNQLQLLSTPRRLHSARRLGGKNTDRRALSEYLQHQLQLTRERLQRRANKQHVHFAAAESRRRRRRRQSLARKLALAILGENNGDVKSVSDSESSNPTTGDNSRGQTPQAHSSGHPLHVGSKAPAAIRIKHSASEAKILRIVTLLQREIDLDTHAIAAFRQRLDGTHAPSTTISSSHTAPPSPPPRAASSSKPSHSAPSSATPSR